MEKYKGIFYWFWSAIASFILKKWGWTIEGDFVEKDRVIIVLAPHRKGVADVVLGWCVKEIHPIPPLRFLAKWEVYYSPLWPILWWLGGVPIDRKRDKNSNVPKGGYIQLIINLFKRKKKLALVITPEGTRTEGAPWKRGFYVAAITEGIPVIFVAFYYTRKKVVLSKPVHMIGDATYDRALIKNWYAQNAPGYEPNLEECFKS